MVLCKFCFDFADYAFVGKTIKGTYKKYYLCNYHNENFMRMAQKQGIKREFGMAEEFFKIERR